MKRTQIIASAIAVTVLTTLGMSHGVADAKANASMIHMKTVAGISSLPESAGVVVYAQGGAISLAPGIAAALVSLLGLPEGALPEGAAFATADVTLFSTISGKK